MADSVPSPAAARHRVIPEIKPEMIQADLRKADIGGCLDDARAELKWTLDQLAGALGRDPRQVRRWIAGEERTQVDVVFTVVALRAPFVVAMARLADCEIETTVRIRRSA